LTPGSDDPDYIRELRLQNFDNLNVERIKDLAARVGSHKLHRAVNILAGLAEEI
jgi:hypothetical protein